MSIIKVDEKISLKPLQETNPLVLFELIDSNREHFGKFLNWVPSIKTVEDEEKYLGAIENDETVCGFSILCDGKTVGSIGFIEINKINNNAQIGYCLAKDFQGQGIMTKSCKKIVEYGFEELGLKRIEIRAAINNEKSKAVIKRLNANYEGTLRSYYKINDAYVDCDVYSIIK